MLDITAFAGPLDLMVKRLFDIVASTVIIILSTPLLLLNLAVGARFRTKKIADANGKGVSVSYFEKGFGFMKGIPLYFSILIGRLSIVGSEIMEYNTDDLHPIYKPGLTGLVQLKSREKKHELTNKEKDYYNLYYIKNQSIVTDLQIIIKSIF